MQDCTQLIDQFINRNLSGWPGLAPVCKKEELEAVIHFRDGTGTAVLGTQAWRYVFRVVKPAAFVSGVDFYFLDEMLVCIGTEYWSFDHDECVRLKKEMGNEAVRLDMNWRENPVPGGEWVYPQKGISLGIVPDTDLIVRLLVFAPCSIETYRERYYQTEGQTDLPKRAAPDQIE